MDRANSLSKIIGTFDKLITEGKRLFASESILPNTSILIEEFFERSYNPYLKQAKRAIAELPIDDYIPISINKWIKSLRNDLETSEYNQPEEFAEVFYIKQKYIPLLIEEIQNIKLEVLEKLYLAEITTDKEVKSEIAEPRISAQESALIISNLSNFGFFRQDVNLPEMLRIISPLVGISNYELEKNITINSTTSRMEVEASVKEYESVAKMLRAMAARLENDAMLKRKKE